MGIEVPPVISTREVTRKRKKERIMDEANAKISCKTSLALQKAEVQSINFIRLGHSLFFPLKVGYSLSTELV